jgi:hypothetical protein
MGSSAVNFFYDQLFVKEPGTTERTPWHQDQPYWALQGSQICSVWVRYEPEEGLCGFAGCLKPNAVVCPGFSLTFTPRLSLSKVPLDPIPKDVCVQVRAHTRSKAREKQ